MDERSLRGLIRSISGSLATGLAFAAGLPGMAQAAEPVPALTGTQLRDNARPVRVITREDLRRSGHFTLGALLQELPQAGPTRHARVNVGGDGTTPLDLRGLGNRRLLVLVDGRRWTGTTGTRGLSMAVDLDQFPLSSLERIEILLDGASAAYGADAVAGVVNLITRRDIEGIEARAQRGRFDAGDGAEALYDFSVGKAWSGGRASASAALHDAEPVAAGDRNISQEPLWGTLNRLGSSATPDGSLRIPDAGFPFSNPFGATRGTGGDFTPTVTDFRPFSSLDLYGFERERWLAAPATHRTLQARLEQTLATDWILGVELWHLERDSAQRLESYPLSIGGTGVSADGALIGVDATNPFNIFGADLDPLAGDPGLHLQALRRRMVESGGQRSEQASTTERVGLTLDGDAEPFGRPVTWTLAHHWTDSSAVAIQRGQFDTSAIATALGPIAACTAPCVPLNLFGGAGSITRSMLDYIGVTLQDHSARTTTESAVAARTDLYRLPAGPLAAAFGLTRRTESGQFSQDPLVAAGNTTVTALGHTRGEYDSLETWAEFAVPITASLAAGVALRHTDWHATAVPTSTGLTLAWRPHTRFALQASLQRGHSLPGLEDLFQSRTPDFVNVFDPCTTATGRTDQEIANCTGVVTNGVAPAINGPYVPTNYVQAPLPTAATFGGNADLAPSASEGTRLGFEWRPGWVEGLSLEVERWDLQRTGITIIASGQTILNHCYGMNFFAGGGRQQFCDLVSRAADGSITGLRTGPVNALSLEASGVDLRLHWKPEALMLPGAWQVTWDVAWLDDYREYSSSPTNLYDGSFNPFEIPFPDQTKPAWRAALAVDWTLGSWEAAWRTRFIGRSDEFCSSSYTAIGFPCSAVAQSRNSIGATTYHDVQVSYVVEAWDTRISFGVRNLGDKKPPLSAQADDHSFDVTTYEVPGRFPYLRIAREFD